MTGSTYPHARDDCASCRAYDADMSVDHDDLEEPVRWCQRCAGPLLARLVLTGHTVTVRSPHGDAPSPPLRRQAAAGNRAEPSGSAWTVEFAEEVLRQALPSGSVFLRALVDEGGTATVARLKDLTGSNALHYMTLTLNTAARKLRRPPRGEVQLGGERPRVARPVTDPDNPRSQTVHSYVLDDVPVWDEALRRLGR